MQELKKVLGMVAVLALVGGGCASTPATPSDIAMEHSDDTAMMEDHDDAMNASDDAMMQEDGIFGTWVVTHAEGEGASLNEGTEYTIVEATSEFSTKKGIFNTKGTISSLSDNSIEVMFEGYTVPFTYTYELVDGKLMLTVDNSGGQVLTLERK